MNLWYPILAYIVLFLGGDGCEDVDQDNDGWPYFAGDCDDMNAAVNPDAVEICDGVDNDCDALIDDCDPSVEGQAIWYYDQDSDGYGSTDSLLSCDDDVPDGYVTNSDDCNDFDATQHPGASEYCDGVDQDCNLAYPECDLADYDADGYDLSLDCDDLDSSINPGALEVCEDGIDQNCDESPYCFSGEAVLDQAHAYFVGSSDNGFLGWAVEASADLTGDGYADIIISAPKESTRAEDAGTIYIFSGPFDNLYDTSCAVAVIQSTTTNQQLGNALAVGHLNDDSIPDLVVGAPFTDGDGEDRGAVYVFFGPLAGAYEVADASIAIVGANNSQYLGLSLHISDLNGDMQSDLVVGAPGSSFSDEFSGATYLFWGPMDSAVSLSSASLRIDGKGDYSWSGVSITSADVSGDGSTDLVIGAPGTDVAFGYEGSIYVLESPIAGKNSVANASARIDGSDFQSYFGLTISSGGDLNGDAMPDIAVGGIYDYGNELDSGAVYLFYGPLRGEYDRNDADSILLGESSDDLTGFPVEIRGDLNHDGIADLIVGAMFSSISSSNAGRAYIAYGPYSEQQSLSDAANRMGRSSEAYAGGVVFGRIDLNGDSTPDVLISAPGESYAATYGGVVYLFFGGAF